jgi:hypothetical protein
MYTIKPLRYVSWLLIGLLLGCGSREPAPSGFQPASFEVLITKVDQYSQGYDIDFEIVNKTNRPYVYGPNVPYFTIFFYGKTDDGTVYTENVSVPEMEPNSRQVSTTALRTSGKKVTISHEIKRDR